MLKGTTLLYQLIRLMGGATAWQKYSEIKIDEIYILLIELTFLGQKVLEACFQ